MTRRLELSDIYPRIESRGYPFAWHCHRSGSEPWQVQLIGHMNGGPALEHCPPDCPLPRK